MTLFQTDIPLSLRSKHNFHAESTLWLVQEDKLNQAMLGLVEEGRSDRGMKIQAWKRADQAFKGLN